MKFACVAAVGIVAGITLSVVASTASAETAYSLTTQVDGDQAIFKFDTDNLGLITGGVISGTGGEALADIDINPVNNVLYGIGATSGTLYQIDPVTMTAFVAVADPAVGTPLDIDFNPVADRLRIFSTGDQNYRLTSDAFDNPGLTAGDVTADGTLTYATGDTNDGAAPNLVGNAYTNNVNGAATTALYSLDSDLDALILHSNGPAFSTLNTVASLTLGGNPFDLGELAGFDIATDGIAYVSNNDELYSLDLTTGALTSIGSIFPFGLSFQGIAVGDAVAAVPEPSSVVMSLMALTGLLVWRWRR